MLSSSSASTSGGIHRKHQELSQMISSFQIEQMPTTTTSISKPSGPPDISRNPNFRVNCSSTKSNSNGSKHANMHKRHFSLDAGMRVSKTTGSNKRVWYNDMGLEGMPEESSLSTTSANSLFEELMNDKLSIKEALEGIDDKTLNGLVQVVETKGDANPTPAPTPVTSSTSVINSNQVAVQPMERPFWTPIQRVHQINEYWAAACTPTPTQSIPAATPLHNGDGSGQSEGHPNFGSMQYWQAFVEEFFESDPNATHGPVNSPSDIGLLVYIDEGVGKSGERVVTSVSSRQPYFIPRPLIARFFWTMAGGLESTKMSEPPMTSCKLSIERVRESYASVMRASAPASLILLEATASTLQVTRSNGLQTEQRGSTKLWFSTQSKIVRWEWTVAGSVEWRMAANSGVHSGYHGKSLRLIAGFTPRTWAVLELAHLTKTYASIIPFVPSGADVTPTVTTAAKRPIPRINKPVSKKDDTLPLPSSSSSSSKKDVAPTVISQPQQQAYTQPSIQPQPQQQQQPYPHHLQMIQPNLVGLLMHSLQQQQSAINKLQIQMTAFMAAYAPPPTYHQSPVMSPTFQHQQYPTLQQYSQPLPAPVPRQDHVFSHYAGPGGSAERVSTKKAKNASKKAANTNNNRNRNLLPPSMSLNNSILTANSLAPNNFVPLSPPMEEDCVNQFLIDDYPLVDHNDGSSLLLGPDLHAMNSLDLSHTSALERIFSGGARYESPN